MATKKLGTTCEWGSCTALATTNVDYPAVVRGTARHERDWQLGIEPMACCDDCAGVARAEVAATWPRPGYSKCDRCGETITDLDAGFCPGLHQMGHDCGGTWHRVRHYRGEDGIVGYQDGDILIDDSTGEHSLAVRDGRGVVLRPLVSA